MKGKKGMTLVELLVVLVISLIMAGAIFFLYRSLVGRTAEMGTLMKNESQLYFVIDNLAKLISSAGFGIDGSQLNYGQVINLQQQDLTILTRASTQETNTPGCWGIIDEKGNFLLSVDSNDIRQISFTTGRECPQNPSYYPIRISLLDKSSNCQRNCLAFPNLPAIQVRLYTDAQNLSPVCLPGTRRLMLDMNGAAADIIQCIGDLRFRYLARAATGEVVAQDNPPPYDNLVGVRLCMMVQLSEAPSESREYEQPRYTERCGGESLNIQNWNLRKWAVVEQDIFMPNLAR